MALSDDMMMFVQQKVAIFRILLWWKMYLILCKTRLLMGNLTQFSCEPFTESGAQKWQQWGEETRGEKNVEPVKTDFTDDVMSESNAANKRSQEEKKEGEKEKENKETMGSAER